MPKKNASKLSVAIKGESIAEKQNLPNKTHEVDLKRKKPDTGKPEDFNQPKKGKRKKLDEIDEIFAALKRRKTEQTKTDKSGYMKEKIKKKISKVSNENEALNTDSRPRIRTNDGFVIYSAEELGINKKDAGETALCPFDCSCCF